MAGFSGGPRAVMLLDLLMALSLAALFFVRIWSQTLTYSRADTYVMKTPPTPAIFYGLIIDVLLLGGAFWGVITWARRKSAPFRFRVAQFCFLASLIVPLNGCRAILAAQFDYLRSPLIEIIPVRQLKVIGALILLAAVLAMLRWLRFFTGIAGRFLILVSPFVLLSCGQALWRAMHYSDAGFRNSPPAPMLSTAGHTRRVVWMVADEWDYRLSFQDRAPGIALPEIDRFRNQSFFALQAYPPGPQTDISLPSLIVGRRAESTRARGPSQLELRFPGDPKPAYLDALPNIFGRMRQEGSNVALVGWYLPYCRSFPSDLVSCEWWTHSTQANSYGDTLAEVVPSEVRSLVETNVLSPLGQTLAAKQAGQVYKQWLERARADVARADFDVVFLHAPVPHAPFAYDAVAGTFTRGNSLTKGYLDNLVLLDRTIGALRDTLEKSGLWDRTAVLMSSDHHYRESQLLDGKSSPLVPFMLKLPRQAAGFTYDAAFNTVCSGDLLLEVLRGNVSTPEQAARWLAVRQAGTDPR